MKSQAAGEDDIRQGHWKKDIMMRIKLSQSDWKEIGAKMGWLKTAEAAAVNWSDITARYRAIGEKLERPDPLGRGTVARIDELLDILRDMAWGDGSGRGGEFMRVMNDATVKLRAVKDSLLRSQDDSFDGDREGSRRQVENAYGYLAHSYRYIIEAHKLRSGGGADMGKSASGDTCWEGYTRRGTKMKGGRRVPNCVPVDGKKGS